MRRAFALAGCLHGRNFGAHGFFAAVFKHGKEFIAAQPVNLIGAFQLAHENLRHGGDVYVALHVAVGVVDLFQLVDVAERHADDQRRIALVAASEVCKIFFIAVTASYARQRVHHQLPAKHHGRILQREEKGDHYDCAKTACEKQLRHHNLRQLHRNEECKHGQQRHFFMRLQPLKAKAHGHSARNKEAEPQPIAHKRRHAVAVIRSVANKIIDRQKRQCDQIRHGNGRGNLS